jgi:hypothetical protein
VRRGSGGGFQGLGFETGQSEGVHHHGPPEHLFEDLRVPQPANVNESLRQLSRAGHVVRRREGGTWSLTPAGRRRVAELMGQIDPAKVEPQIAELPGAEFGHELHTVIPPSLAPVRWAAPIKALLDRSPFEENVFCMTRFPEEDEEVPDPVSDVVATARDALGQHGLTVHTADDRVLDGDLLGNVAAHMWACRYGVALFEDRRDEGLNYNLVTEVGSMLMTGRRCALLKDVTAPDMPTDLVGQIYKPVDYDDHETVARELHMWGAEDLGLGRCAACPAI